MLSCQLSTHNITNSQLVLSFRVAPVARRDRFPVTSSDGCRGQADLGEAQADRRLMATSLMSTSTNGAKRVQPEDSYSSLTFV